MTRRWFLIAVPLLLLAAVLAVWFGDSGPAEQTKPEQKAPAVTPAAPTPAPPTAAPVEATATRTSTEPEQASGQPAVPADAVWVSVLVVDQRTQEPVADAEVAWLDGQQWLRFGSLSRAAVQALNNDVEQLARKFGWQARTDRQGKVRVHLGPRATSVCARQGNRYGSVSFQTNTETPPEGHRIELRDDLTLVVKVKDSRAEPMAGAPVQIGRHDASGTFLRESGSSLPRTDQDGISRLPHVQERRWDEGNELPGSGAQWRVRTKIPGIKDPGVAFDPLAPPADPLVLTLPPCGSVEAWVTFRGNQVATQLMALNLASVSGNDLLNTSWQQQPDADGRFRYPSLPVDQDWIALGMLGGAGRVEHKFTGPTTANPHVKVEVPVPEDHLVLAGRFLDDQGRPLTQASVGFEYEASFGGGGGQLQTDASARFLWFCGPAGKSNRVDNAKFSLHRQDSVMRTAVVANRELTPGMNDLGDLMLTQGRLVAAGRFVMEGGAASQYPQMHVQRPQPEAGSATDTWQQCAGLTTSNFADGRFEVRGDTTQVRHRLYFPAQDHLPVAPIEFLPGARDLEIRIHPGNALTATVLLPRNLPRGCEAELQPEGPAWPVADAPDRDRYRLEPWRSNGEQYRLQWTAVPRGAYTLAFRVRGVQEPLLELTGVQVPAPAGGHPRLRDIDLRELVATLTMRITDAQGQPFDPGSGQAMAFVQPQDAAATWRGFMSLKNELRMPVPKRGIDLLIVRYGLPPKLVTGARGEMELRLDPWPEQTIIVPDLPALPDGFAITAWLLSREPVSSGRYDANGQSGGRDFYRAPGTPGRLLDGRVSLPIGAGVHRLVLQLWGTEQRRVALTGVFPNEVVAGPPLQMRVDAEQLQQAIATLQAPAKGK